MIPDEEEECVPKRFKQVTCCHDCARYRVDEICDDKTPLTQDEILR